MEVKETILEGEIHHHRPGSLLVIDRFAGTELFTVGYFLVTADGGGDFGTK